MLNLTKKIKYWLYGHTESKLSTIEAEPHRFEKSQGQIRNGDDEKIRVASRAVSRAKWALEHPKLRKRSNGKTCEI
ncbi:MAG: hypothetical protein KA239_08005 [Bacteroidia bacterium]|nr:hypothetical protein [Bacteroidia bacterium]